MRRLPTAALLCVSGYVHLDLWRDGYRFIDNVGVLFLLTAITAGALAVAVLVRPGRLVLLAVAGFSATALGGLLLSRTEIGILGYTEPGWSPDATATLAAEVGTLVAAAVLAVGTSQARREEGARRRRARVSADPTDVRPGAHPGGRHVPGHGTPVAAVHGAGEAPVREPLAHASAPAWAATSVDS